MTLSAAHGTFLVLLGPAGCGTPPGLAGLRDSHVGRVLNLLHGAATAAWTLERLAREAGLSRSSLAERFARLVGQLPMQYLAQWRLPLAAGMPADIGYPVARIAAQVGYHSEAAFSRAFHRFIGVPPAAWRRARAPTSAKPCRNRRAAPEEAQVPGLPERP